MNDQSDQRLSAHPQEEKDFLEVASIPEDWGGDGSGRLNLSGRYTAISSKHLPGQCQFFDSNAVPEENSWRISGTPSHVVSARRRLLTWHDCGASTARVFLPPNFEMPPGMFTADLEIFVLSGKIQLGDWQLRKHGYSFIPAGVKVGPIKVLNNEPAEILWMENGPIPLRYEKVDTHHPKARLGDFIPALDSQLLPWGKTQTAQFEVAKKKFLRKDTLGGGAWLLAILPHYDGEYPFIQTYNEDGYCLSGYCDVGEYHLTQDYVWYCSSFSDLPRHSTVDGGLFFVRADRDVSQVSRVLSHPFA